MSSFKPRILPDELLQQLARQHGTPLYVYDAATIARRIDDLAGFDAIRFAQKANSNLTLLAFMRKRGVHVDAVSAGEVARALAVGYAAPEIAFTSDLFDRAALELLERQPLAVNCGSPFMVEQLARRFPGRAVTLRVNPGFGHGHTRKVNTGGETSKHGIWHEDLAAVIARARALALRVIGLHVHLGSGSDFENMTRVCGAMRKLAPLVGEELETISTGGGLPIPYRAQEAAFDVARFRDTWLETRAHVQSELGHAITLEVEPGRFLVAECGMLLTEVRGRKRMGSLEYVLVDAGFHNLIRPAMYGAFHQISIVGKDGEPRSPKVVAGPLCESGDVFTQGHDGQIAPQELPDAVEGDLACVHDAGAYGAAMASNYNSQPFAAEVWVEAGRARLARRRQTIDEMLASERDLMRE